MGATSSGVGGRFFATALVWLIPAALALPFALVLIAISVAASDGGLLEMASGVRGKILTALGPLLILCGIAAVVVAAVLHADIEGWVAMGSFALVSIMVGWWASRRAWRRLAAE